MEAPNTRNIINDLAELVKASAHFRARTEEPDKLTDALDAFVRAYASSGSQPDIHASLAHRLKQRLEDSFKKDRNLWNPHQQYLLDLPSPKRGLALEKLSRVITGTTDRFWFHQSARFDSDRTFVVFSEPLFFFSRNLRAYLRFLNINHDGSVDNEEELVNQAKRELNTMLRGGGLDQKAAKDVLKALDLVPVHHYVGAGDSYGASVIRRWFRKNKMTPPRRREGSRIVDIDRGALNCIVLASRRTNRDLTYFAQRTPKLHFELTENGIRAGETELRDEFGKHGMTLARVIVTNWVFADTDNVYTIVASNHTRAVGRIAEFLVSGELDRHHRLPNKLLAADGMIPSRVQFAFSVPLHENELRATIHPELIGDPIIFK